MQNGESVIGTLLHRDDRSVRLKTSDSEIEIPAANVKSVESAPSGMPEVAAFVLSKAEIRDLVEYLASQKEMPKPRSTTLRALRGPAAK